MLPTPSIQNRGLAQTDTRATGGVRLTYTVRRVGAHFTKEELFCFTYGDGVGNVDLSGSIDFHRRRQVSATVTATPTSSPLPA